MQIIPLGDSALIVRVRDRFDDAPEETLDTVLRAFQQLRGANIPGVIELAPAYTSVAVFFDPVAVARATETPDKMFEWLATRIRGVVAAGAERGRHRSGASPVVRLLKIPVCYDREFALDIDDVARCAKTSPSEVVRLHSAAEYRVACIGFVPGFPFLTGLPKELATPRREFIRCVRPAAGTSSVARHCACSILRKIRPHFCARATAYDSGKSLAMNLKLSSTNRHPERSRGFPWLYPPLGTG